ncbi:hypothetical protein CHS0354_020576 [Potamilus streckersoni]|uniref:UBX domain-containing protein n=1 Tax=Potamilus streckersoni TaxID=2493646 RepID=A0AAE0VHV5_9BIVA|nr:hypothetical protein CHS0354_020576 [Potamilus streckersoni]
MSYNIFTRWTLFFASALGLAGMSYLQIDFGTLVQFGLKTLLILGLLTFVIQYIGLPLLKRLKTKSTLQQDTQEPDTENVQKLKQARKTVQEKYSLEASSYKERILKPREDAKRAQNERELYRFMGPAWKGKGDVLGGENTLRSPDTDQAGRDAAVHRQLPEWSNEVSRNIAKQLKQVRSNKEAKKVIVLPDEPPDGTADSILVVLRTPIGTAHKRRFLVSHTVQVLLDFMTVIGFHQRAYTIATSYPRYLLGKQADSTLEELGFIRQVVLNIEEIEL